MKTIALKFGGTSMADANQIRKVTAIIKQSQHRRYIVVSAPGKRSSDDIKVTDLLYQCYNAAVKGEDFEPSLLQIRERFWHKKRPEVHLEATQVRSVFLCFFCWSFRARFAFGSVSLRDNFFAPSRDIEVAP